MLFATFKLVAGQEISIPAKTFDDWTTDSLAVTDVVPEVVIDWDADNLKKIVFALI